MFLHNNISISIDNKEYYIFHSAYISLIPSVVFNLPCVTLTVKLLKAASGRDNTR